LKAPVQGFEALQGIQQLEGSLAHMDAGFGKLLRVLNRELDSINRDPSLVCHLEFHR
jgi:hypothetical protein